MVAALVLGSGIGGSSAAIALRRIGFDVTVAEARPEDATELGSWLTVQSNGLAGLRVLGVLDAVRGAGFTTPAIDLTSSSGRVLGTVPLGSAASEGEQSLSIARPTLHRILRDAAVEVGATVTYRRRFLRWEGDDGERVAVFHDGARSRADLFVGADGLRSTVRGQLSDRNPLVRYLPLLNLGGVSEPLDLDVTPGRLHMVFGRSAFFGYVVAPDRRVWWFANPPRRREPAPGELAGIPSEQWRRTLQQLFARDSSPASRIVAATPGPFEAWTTYDLPHVPVWQDGRAVLIGDAAHAVAPSSGQGASLAVEDAVVLAKCLRDAPDVPAALVLYENLRRDRVEKIVAAGRRTSSTKVAGPLSRRIRDAVLPMILRRVGRDGAGGQAWIYDYDLTWDAPVGV
jgi:2-polyprenyl-6-methoxyphenol hydroxylase-like FAD-dependent oxidoreductase